MSSAGRPVPSPEPDESQAVIASRHRDNVLSRPKKATSIPPSLPYPYCSRVVTRTGAQLSPSSAPPPRTAMMDGGPAGGGRPGNLAVPMATRGPECGGGACAEHPPPAQCWGAARLPLALREAGRGRFSPILVFGVPTHLSRKGLDQAMKVKREDICKSLSPDHI